MTIKHCQAVNQAENEVTHYSALEASVKKKEKTHN